MVGLVQLSLDQLHPGHRERERKGGEEEEGVALPYLAAVILWRSSGPPWWRIAIHTPFTGYRMLTPFRSTASCGLPIGPNPMPIRASDPNPMPKMVDRDLLLRVESNHKSKSTGSLRSVSSRTQTRYKELGNAFQNIIQENT